MLKMFSFFLLILLNSFLFAKECPTKFDSYGNAKQYQEFACRLMVSADKTDSTFYRNITFNDEGMIQVFSNFKGTTNSNSTGARVFFLFPIRTDRKVVDANKDHLVVQSTSGALFNFDNSGNLTATNSDLKIVDSKEINSSNKSGIEISHYKKGLVVDLGYRMGNTPTLNPNAVVTITDKNDKKCQMPNSDFMNINSKKYESELRYKTNAEFHKFLTKRCPDLDISDLLLADSASPQRSNAQININDSSRSSSKEKTTSDALAPNGNTSNSYQK